MSFTDGFAVGYAAGRKRGGSGTGGNEGSPEANTTKLRAAIEDDELGNLTVVLDDKKKADDVQEGDTVTQNIHEYIYTFIHISKTCTVMDADGNSSTTTVSRDLVDKLYNSENKLLLTLIFDYEKLEITGYTDADGNTIYIDGGYEDE